MNSFIQQGCIKLIKYDSKDVYIVVFKSFNSSNNSESNSIPQDFL